MTEVHVRRAAFSRVFLHQDASEGEGGGARGAHPDHLVAHALRQGGRRLVPRFLPGWKVLVLYPEVTGALTEAVVLSGER